VTDADDRHDEPIVLDPIQDAVARPEPTAASGAIGGTLAGLNGPRRPDERP
jgi:hypothetical protein